MTETESPLEDGLSASTPSGDNIVRDFTTGLMDAYEALATAVGGRTKRVDPLGLSMSDASSLSPFANTAHLEGPIDRDDLPHLVNALQSFYRAAEGGPFLLFSAFPMGDLRPFGFVLGGHPPLMVRSPGSIHVPTPDLRIERVTDAAALQLFERTLIEAYPAPELIDGTEPRRLLGPDLLDSSWRLFLGYEGDAVVATSGAYLADGATIVEMVSTRAEYRGRGIGAALTAAAMLTRGDKPAALRASDPGRNVYAGLGFVAVMRQTLWIGHR